MSGEASLRIQSSEGVVPAQREPYFRGSQPSGSMREEKPPMTMQRTVEREQMVPGVVQT
jgi:hypothetical protein